MLVNGNFANGLNNWASSGSATIDTSEYKVGLQSLRIQGGGANQHVSLVVGHTYLFQVWVMTGGTVVADGSSGAGLYVYDPSSHITIQKANGTAINLDNIYPGSLLETSAATPWTLLQLTFAVATSGTYVMNVTGNYGSSSTNAPTWFSGASLTDTTGAADVTASQPIVYAASSESIVPNGNFVLGTLQGWLQYNYTYGSDSYGTRVFGGPLADHLFSPAFQVVPGQKYRMNYCVYNSGAGSPAYSGEGPGIYLRLAWQATNASNVIPATSYADFLGNANLTTSPTVYSYDWTAPAGANYASMCLYAVGYSDLACKYVSCIPYAAAGQWGADVTGSNTSNDTSNVSGVPASTIASVVPTGYKLFINSGSRSYSIEAI
jgi:hypothetical protein